MRMPEPPAPTPPPAESDPTSEEACPLAPPGPPAKWVTPPTPGEVITSEMTGNTYTMGDQIGEGHFGRVFGCVDVWGNQLAAKVMKPLGSYEKVKKASTEAEFRKLFCFVTPILPICTTRGNSGTPSTSSRSAAISHSPT